MGQGAGLAEGQAVGQVPLEGAAHQSRYVGEEEAEALFTRWHEKVSI
jgi:hypothetical protein